jgi:hypothetical protein
VIIHHPSSFIAHPSSSSTIAAMLKVIRAFNFVKAKMNHQTKELHTSRYWHVGGDL